MNFVFNFIFVILLYFSAYQSLLAHGSHRHEDSTESEHVHRVSEISHSKKESQIAEQRIKDLETYLEDQGISVETSQTGIKLGGYVDVGYVYNFNGGRASSGKGENPITGEDSQDFNLNKVQIYLAKELPDENRLAAGFAFALDFGEDVEQGHFHGGHEHHDHEGEHDVHNFELHEAAVFFRAPIGNGLDVTLGKWHSLLGYESHDRPYNMNYTFGLLSRFMDPGEHIGFLLTYPVADWFTVDLGLANGWANEDSAFLDDSDFSKMLTGAFTFRSSGKNAWLRMGFAYSPEGEERFSNVVTADHSDHKHKENGEELLQENEGLLALSLHGDWRPVFAKNRWLLGFNTSLLWAEDNLHRAELKSHDEHEPEEEHGHDEADHEHEEEDHPEHRYGPGIDRNSATAFGLALYTRYQLCDWFSLGGRLEYLHANDGTLGFVDGLNVNSTDQNRVFVSSTDLYSWTLTAGFDIWANMVLRLEYRLDMSSSNGAENLGAFQNNQDEQHTFALNAAYLF